MPTTYTHDLFGKKIYRRMPEEVQMVMRENGDLYRIGLHGPDILFYHLLKSRVYKVGIRMHHEKARAFFEKGLEKVRKTGNRELLAYLLGFGCHYLLDSACHPFVNETAETGVVSHTVLEKEFDRSLMLEAGKDPYHFYPSDCIVPKISYAETIHQAIPEVSAPGIFHSLKMMKFITNAMVYDNDGRRIRLFRFLGKPAGKKRTDTMLEYFMAGDPVPESRIPVQKLKKLYLKALEETPEYLMELYGLSKEQKALSGRWDRTYNG